MIVVNKECHRFYIAGCYDGRDNPYVNICDECRDIRGKKLSYQLTGRYHTPKPYSLVEWYGNDEIYEKYYADKFPKDKLLFISEVSNMKDHCILCDLTTGKLIGPYHTENFRTLFLDEV